MTDNLDLKLLSYILNEKRLLLNIQTHITSQYVHTKYRKFYNIVIACFNKFKEIPTLKVMQEQAKKIWTEEMNNIYSDAISLTFDEREFPFDVEKLKIRYNVQLLQKTGQSVFQNNWNGEKFLDLTEANKEIKRLSSSIDSIYGKRIFQEGSLSKTAKNAWGEYQNRKNNPGLAKGIHLGFREFDRITNGLQKSELMLIGGESGAGKSALAMNMAINAWMGSNVINSQEFTDDGHNVLYFSIEMPYRSMRNRCDSCIAGIPLYGIRDGTLTIEEEEKYKSALKFQKKYHKQFHILDIPRDCTVGQIESKFIDISNEWIPDLIVVDYITLMRPDEEEGGDWLKIGRVAEQLHEFCRTYEIPVISPVQLTKPPKNGEVSIDQNRVGRSILLVQNSNILLNIQSRKDENLRTDMPIHIGKMRDGEQGAFVLHKRLDIMRIFDDVPGWEPECYEEKDGY